jgi:hypothetical protein
MKKFYVLVFTVFFLLTSYFSKAQITYTSILTNPTNLTLDDPGFWQGVTGPPPNPCNNCTILVYASTLVPQQGQSTWPPDNGGPFTNHIVLNNSLLKLQGANTTLNINTYLSLTNGSTVFVGTDQSYNVSILLNDQVDMDATSSIQIGSNASYIDANNGTGNPVIGPYDDYFNSPSNDAGIYSIFGGPPVGGVNYSFVLGANGIGFNQLTIPPPTLSFAFYNINCTGPGGCTFGIINGPALTGPDPGAGPVHDYGVIFSVSTTLPVELVQFLANKSDNGSVELSWATSQEVNAGYYDVERSGDQTGWLKLGSVKAKGNSSTTTNYSYTDKLPLDGAGYYRLKMVDLDGKFKYSKTVSVTGDKNSLPLVIYSNPFSDLIRFKVNVSRAQTLTMTVSDIMGKTYISKTIQARAGDNLVNLQSNIGGSGMYILHINGDSYNQTVKLEKQ